MLGVTGGRGGWVSSLRTRGSGLGVGGGAVVQYVLTKGRNGLPKLFDVPALSGGIAIMIPEHQANQLSKGAEELRHGWQMWQWW